MYTSQVIPVGGIMNSSSYCKGVTLKEENGIWFQYIEDSINNRIKKIQYKKLQEFFVRN
jgi:hypothetical protein